VKPWKVILAAIVIFVAGAVTGAVVYTQFLQKKAAESRPSGPPIIPRPEFSKWLADKLQLTKEQQEKIEKILIDSHERLKPLRELIDPVMQDEVKRVKEEIMKELTPEQQKKYEDLFKWRPPKRPEGRPFDGTPPGGGRPPEMKPQGDRSGGPPPFPRGDSRNRRPDSPRFHTQDSKSNEQTNLKTNTTEPREK
jgi:Spy/CpxP family protein refolding chaperone